MTCTVIGLITVTNATQFEAYKARVGGTIEQYGGTVEFRGVVGKVYAEEHAKLPYEACVVISFESAEAADTWSASPEYQAIIGMRQAGALVTLFRAEG